MSYIILAGNSPYYGVFFRHPNSPEKLSTHPVGDGFYLTNSLSIYSDLQQACKDCDEALASIPMPTDSTNIRVVELPLQVNPGISPHGIQGFYDPELSRVYTPSSPGKELSQNAT